MEPYEVFVQWKRGRPHEHAETITASDNESALMLAKRNIDLRSDPIDLWVVPRAAITRIDPDDTSLTPSTDREYRRVTGYSNHPTPTGQ